MSLRNRRAAKKKFLPNEEFEVGVQRLVLILAAEEALKIKKAEADEDLGVVEEHKL